MYIKFVYQLYHNELHKIEQKLNFMKAKQKEHNTPILILMSIVCLICERYNIECRREYVRIRRRMSVRFVNFIVHCQIRCVRAVSVCLIIVANLPIT